MHDYKTAQIPEGVVKERVYSFESGSVVYAVHVADFTRTRAEKDGDRRPLAPLLERLHKFQEGNLRCLMYKDWDAFERFVAELTGARGAAEAVPVLHRCGTYLETLFGQINMRVVLIDYPFAYPTLD